MSKEIIKKKSRFQQTGPTLKYPNPYYLTHTLCYRYEIASISRNNISQRLLVLAIVMTAQVVGARIRNKRKKYMLAKNKKTHITNNKAILN